MAIVLCTSLTSFIWGMLFLFSIFSFFSNKMYIMCIFFKIKVYTKMLIDMISR